MGIFMCLDGIADNDIRYILKVEEEIITIIITEQLYDPHDVYDLTSFIFSLLLLLLLLLVLLLLKIELKSKSLLERLIKHRGSDKAEVYNILENVAKDPYKRL